MTDYNQILEAVADSTPPQILWSFILIVFVISVIVSIIFVYHWYNYHTNRQMFITAGLVYFIGLVILFSLAVSTILTFIYA